MAEHPELVCRLKDYRQKAGLTQAQLAEQVFVSRKTVNTIENGVFVPTTVLALKLAHALDCRVEDLFSLRGRD
ncbi:helix-turn-helix transcriptional regulator [Henriciella sp.]|uniref:helix-turn-helix transcriptional regulator n=1 Tax=Henriciella sp. TaxID=1968823 RepID=UPI002624D1C1|nr:helix-turn-helix transcriptional regulator [Henriciella sp.]